MKPRAFRRFPFANTFAAGLGITGGLIFAGPAASADEYYLAGSDPATTSSFTNPLTGAAVGWKLNNAGAAVPPVAGNNYTVGGPAVGGVAVGTLLRAPTDGNSYAFPGDALTILPGGRLLLKSVGTTQVITVNNLMLNGGTTDLAPDANNAAARLAGSIVLGASSGSGGIGASGTRTLTVDSTIGGLGQLAISGAAVNAGLATGTVVINAANTYTGGTRVAGGLVNLANAAGLGPAANALILNGGTLDLNAFPYTQDSLTLGGGVLRSTGGSTFTIPTTANAINFIGTYAFATPAIGAATSVSLTGATGGNIVKTATVGTPVIAGPVDLGGQTRVLALADTASDVAPELTLSGVISNGAVIQDNTLNGTSVQEFGSLLFSGANTYAGLTTIAVGRLEITNATSLGTTAAGTVIGPRGTLAFGGSGQTIAPGITVAEPLSINRTVSGNYGLVAIQNNSGDNVLSGAVSLDATAEINTGAASLTLTGAVSETAPSGLTKSGAALLALSAANTYTGLTTISAGTLRISNNAALGTTAAGTIVSTGAVLSLADGVTVTGEPITIATGGGGDGRIQAFTGASAGFIGDITLGVVNTGTARIGANAGATLTVTGDIKDGTANGLDVSGGASTGTIILTAPASYTGTTNLVRGNLTLRNTAAIGSDPAEIRAGTSDSSEAVVFTVETGASVRSLNFVLGVAGGNQTNNATLALTGGTLRSAAYTVIGSNGKGTATANVSAGTLEVKTVAGAGDQSLELGTFGTVAATFNLSGSGAVRILNDSFIALGAQNNSANNTFNQTGGTVTFFSDGGTTPGGTRAVYLGANSAAGVNTYNLDGGTLTVPMISRTSTLGSGVFNFNGGLLKPTATNALFFGNLTRANVRGGGAKVQTDGFDATIAQPLEHSDVVDDPALDGGLVKSGAGTLTLTMSNTYTGDTTVSAGTLSVQSSAALADGAAVRLATGAILNLDFAGIDTVGQLVINGVARPAGKYGRIGSPDATDTEIAAITGNGQLMVTGSVASSPFQTFAASRGLSGANAQPGADPDSDGFNNLAEFVLGGEPNPANGGSNTAALVPTVTTSGASHVYSFRRTQVADTQPGISVIYEYSTGLTAFTTATNGVNGITIVRTPDFYAPGVDRVAVTIPDSLAGPGAKLFVRMRANLP